MAYRDRILAVLVKAAGVPCGQTRRGGADTFEQQAAALLGPGARVMHRLDRGASGLLLVSLRGGESRKALARQVSEHRMVRRYLARVAGDLPRGSITLDAPLTMARGVARASTDPRAKPARTGVRPLAAPARPGLVQAIPHTGRTHQIRAHLAGAGLPIVGDARYGGPDHGRLCLHAHSLGLRHPDGRWIELHSPLPAEFWR